MPLKDYTISLIHSLLNYCFFVGESKCSSVVHLSHIFYLAVTVLMVHNDKAPPPPLEIFFFFSSFPEWVHRILLLCAALCNCLYNKTSLFKLLSFFLIHAVFDVEISIGKLQSRSRKRTHLEHTRENFKR